MTSYINYSPNYHISAKMGDGYVPGADWIEWGSGPIGWLYKYNLIGLEAVIYGLEPSLQFNFKSSKLSLNGSIIRGIDIGNDCLLYTSDAAEDLTRVELGGRRIIKKI